MVQYFLYETIAMSFVMLYCFVYVLVFLLFNITVLSYTGIVCKYWPDTTE